MKRLIPLLILFSACTKDDDIVPQKNYTFSIDSVLTQSGTKSLPKDSNGLYHLTLIPKSNQQPYRVTGRILLNGKEPIPAENIEWESNLYWWLRRGAMIASKDELVPTTNKSSYSGKNGEINTIIAPISEMKGDTLILKATHYESKKMLITKIVLDG